MQTLVLDLSSCKESEDYYVNVLTQKGNDLKTRMVNKIELDVDRGVNFEVLCHLLHSFPVLTSVSIKQNYSPNECTIDHFVAFLESLHLEKFELRDLQSSFLSSVEPSNLLNLLPSQCDYIIHCGFDLDGEPQSCSTHIDMARNKSLLFRRA